MRITNYPALNRRVALCIGSLFFCGLASAQSNVQIYGIIDAGIRSFPNLAVSEDRITGVDDGIRNRWGIRVKEDLGDGLSAFVRLESSIRLDTGALRDPARFFDDKAWVGLDSRTLGNIALGRLRSPVDEMTSGTRFEAFQGFSLGAALGRTGRADDAWDNGIYYITPNFNGFKAGIGMRAGERTVKNSNGVHAEYTQGPLDVGISYQNDGESLTSRKKSANISATYQFPAFMLLGTYVKTTDVGATDAGEAYVATMGVRVPMGPGEFRAAVKKAPNKNIAGFNNRSADIDTTHIGIGYHYPLSKRTSINASLVQQTRKTYNAAGATLTDRKGNGFDIGIRHYF